jgi:hypothetical protein
MDLKEENFSIYVALVSFTLSLGAIVWLHWWVGIVTFICCVIGFAIFVDRYYTKEIKIISPFPVKLEGQWRFVFYVIRGSYMVTPERLLMDKIKNSG